MDRMKIGGDIMTKSLGISASGHVAGFGLSLNPLKPVPSQQILPMIEQRIRGAVEPQAQQAEKDLNAIINIELGKLGFNPAMTNTGQYVSGIADKYRERLVAERIAALVDSLVAPTQPTKDAP